MVVSAVPEPVGDRKRRLETSDSRHPPVVCVRPNGRRARHDPRHHSPRRPGTRPSRPRPRSSVTQTPVQRGPPLGHRIQESNPSSFFVVVLGGVRLAGIAQQSLFSNNKSAFIASKFLRCFFEPRLLHTYIHSTTT